MPHQAHWIQAVFSHRFPIKIQNSELVQA
jgi:hypothetical protein